MSLLSLLIVLVCSVSATMADRTKTEWEEGINTLLADIGDARHDKNWTAFAEYFTEDFEGFHSGIPGALKFTDLEESNQTDHYELVNLRWFCGNEALFEFTLLRTEEDVKHLGQLLGHVTDEEGVLKLRTGQENYID